VFDGVRLLTSGTLPDVALAAKVVMLANRGEPLIFDDATGRRLELDLYPSAAQVLERAAAWQDQARKAEAPTDQGRLNHERTYRFITVLAGDLPGFEEASRALFAGDPDGFLGAIGPWPQDLKDYAMKLATT